MRRGREHRVLVAALQNGEHFLVSEETRVGGEKGTVEEERQQRLGLRVAQQEVEVLLLENGVVLLLELDADQALQLLDIINEVNLFLNIVTTSGNLGFVILLNKLFALEAGVGPEFVEDLHRLLRVEVLDKLADLFLGHEGYLGGIGFSHLRFIF